MGRDKDKKQEGGTPGKTKKSPKKHPGTPKLSPPSLGETPSAESDSSTPSPHHSDPSGLLDSLEMQLVVINGALYQQKVDDKGKVELIPLPKVMVAALNVGAR